MPVKDWETAESGDLISTMSTYYAVGIYSLQYQGRNWNIRLSSSMITGTILQPGEEYNQHQTIGPFSQSTGYHKAPIMKKDALWGYGGGTCQVSSTLYNTLLPLSRSGISILYRRAHGPSGATYLPHGVDAAVGSDSLNLVFRNDFDFPVRIDAHSDGEGIVYIALIKAS